MSLPTPTTAPGMTMDPKELEAMDAPLIALANRSGGDLRKLMYAFFSFLNRRTDFYLVPHEEDLKEGKPASMGFREGDAEKLLLAAFRQFPLRRIPRQSEIAKRQQQQQQQQQQKDADKNLTSATADMKVTDTAKSPDPVAAAAKTEKKSKESDNGSKTSEKKSILKNDTTVRYTEEGLQIPVGNGGSTSQYKWTQTIEECSVLIGVPENIRGKELDVIIKPNTVTVRSKKPMSVGNNNNDEPIVFLQGDLFDTIDPSESTWTLEGGVLILVLYKKKKTFWKTIIQGDEEIDATLVDSTRHISTYDEATQAQIRKIMFDQNQQRKGLPTSDVLSGKTPEIPPLPPGVEYIDQEILEEKIKEKNAS